MIRPVVGGILKYLIADQASLLPSALNKLDKLNAPSIKLTTNKEIRKQFTRLPNPTSISAADITIIIIVFVI